MPHLARLVENGVIGNIATLNPPYSTMLWTSIATGKRPTKHGVHGFSEPAPDGISIRPVSSLSRKVKAVWNILNQNGFTSGVVGWGPRTPSILRHGHAGIYEGQGTNPLQWRKRHSCTPKRPRR